VTHSELHRALVEHVVRTGAHLRAEADIFMVEAARYVAYYDDWNARQIGVKRERGGASVWWDEKDGLDEDLDFFATVVDPLREAILIAHEFGHDRLAEASGNSKRHTDRLNVWTAALKADAQVTLTAAGEVYAEEVAAWDIGAAVLRELGFQDLVELEKLRRESLATYEAQLRKCCPGWAPPP
jgi:hypothetical protein